VSALHTRPLPKGGDGTAVSFDEVLARLESTIAQLADGTAPLEELVGAHQRAAGLLSEAEVRLGALKARADRLVIALQSVSPIPVSAPAPNE
jgi:exodeoxyribonuclease VII small subunit